MTDGAFGDEGLSKARDVARRFGCKFVDLQDFQFQTSVLRLVPLDVMFRYHFLPLERAPNDRIPVAVSDPSQMMVRDEISILLGRRLQVCVGSADAISRLLKKISG